MWTKRSPRNRTPSERLRLWDPLPPGCGWFERKPASATPQIAGEGWVERQERARRRRKQFCPRKQPRQKGELNLKNSWISRGGTQPASLIRPQRKRKSFSEQAQFQELHRLGKRLSHQQ